MNSLRSRISLGLVLSLALMFAVQGLVARVAVHDLMESFVERELVEDTDELFESLQITRGEGTVQSTLTHIDPSFQAKDTDHYFQIMIDGKKALASASLGDGDLKTTTLAPQQSLLGRVVGPGGQPMLFGRKGFTKDGHAVTIEIGMGFTNVNERVDRMLWRLGLVSAAMTALLLLLQNWIVHRALNVLTRIGSDVQRVSSGDIQQLDEQVPREVRPLVREINNLSSTLSMRLQRSRHALGNLAHALKTPLSLLTQTALQPGHVMASNSSVLDHLGTLRTRIDLELKRARLAGPSSVNTAFDLCADVTRLAGAMRKLYSNKVQELRCSSRPLLLVHADREDMLELLGNLLDNACKYAWRNVVFEASIDDGLLIVVEDDGPGCDDADLEALTQRGVRIDERVDGHGLGLAIAHDIVTSYGGTLELGRSEALGGFRAAVRLPAALLAAHASDSSLVSSRERTQHRAGFTLA
jgi:signal transduction histidine kinase